MRARKLGQTDLRVSELGLGCASWWGRSTFDEATAIRVVHEALDLGVTLFDTGSSYSAGEAEPRLGRALSGRDTAELVIATKAGMDMGEGNKGLSPAYLRRAVDASLQRLGIDCIDLYQAHQDDADTPLEDTLGTFAELIRAGKVRAIGASNYTAPRLAQALAVSARPGLPRYETLQPGYNLADRAGFEAELQPLCVKEGLSVIPYYSLAAGFLSGKYRKPEDLEGRARGARAGSYLNERGLRILAALDAVAVRLGTTQTAVAIAWLRDRPAIAAPIASATSVEQLQALLAGLRLPLDAAAVAALDAASA